MKKLNEIWASFKAAVTSPTAVKQERSLVAFVAFRLLIAAGASAGLAEVLSKLING